MQNNSINLSEHNQQTSAQMTTEKLKWKTPNDYLNKITVSII